MMLLGTKKKVCKNIKSLNCFILKMYASGRGPFMQVLCIAKQFPAHVLAQVVKLIWWIYIFCLSPIFFQSTNEPFSKMTLLHRGMMERRCKRILSLTGAKSLWNMFLHFNSSVPPPQGPAQNRSDPGRPSEEDPQQRPVHEGPNEPVTHHFGMTTGGAVPRNGQHS